jgi:hypothetical protein
MSVEKGLFQLIQSDTNVQSIVTTANGAGLYWVLMPKGAAVPCIVLSRVATDDPTAMAGPVGLRGALFQADCYSATYYGSRALADTVRNLLEPFTGALPDGTNVGGVLSTKDWDMPFEEGGKGFVYRAMLEFRVWYYES